MGFNYWGIFFFVMPIVVSVLVGSITLLLVSIKEIKRKFKIRRVAKCQRYHF
ncbi:MAG: hypothetical protein E7F58_00795 [Clostridium saudiense]|jgi:hypothetical protein|uniref:hypothetical protein n=1 Tax=Clostridium TaxID=1485 RepID=UPI0018A9CB52|nr:MULTISPECIES: hypothetical protein [Clostridium]MDU3520184.1 hypothetical protein [Clostridium saudiense]